MPTRDPIAREAFRRAALASLVVLLAALVGASVRLLPWALDPTIPWSMLAPFAKSLLSVTVEAAILVGWPVGWALAAARLVDRGEALVLATLGERETRTLRRLAPQGLLLAVLLATSSLALGREVRAPGRVVNGLLASGRAACARAKTPETHVVPFVAATWLCASAGGPRLAGLAPGSGVFFTASRARVSDDLRQIELGDARLVPRNDSAGDRAPKVDIHVGTMILRGLAPWARASSLPAVLRAVLVTTSGFGAAAAVFYALLRLKRRSRAVTAVALGAAGPVAALVTLRTLELRVPEAPSTSWLVVFLAVPIVAIAGVLILGVILALLPEARRADSHKD